ncbi:hypothetical protein [Thalassospira alkalitolerans]|uniref:hypothetical protein n=1 Tax=Thalassospira alkalitolerans TaxID=1293890 RepID=UPI003AA90973
MSLYVAPLNELYLYLAPLNELYLYLARVEATVWLAVVKAAVNIPIVSQMSSTSRRWIAVMGDGRLLYGFDATSVWEWSVVQRVAKGGSERAGHHGCVPYPKISAFSFWIK